MHIVHVSKEFVCCARYWLIQARRRRRRCVAPLQTWQQWWWPDRRGSSRSRLGRWPWPPTSSRSFPPPPQRRHGSWLWWTGSPPRLIPPPTVAPTGSNSPRRSEEVATARIRVARRWEAGRCVGRYRAGFRWCSMRTARRSRDRILSELPATEAGQPAWLPVLVASYGAATPSTRRRPSWSERSITWFVQQSCRNVPWMFFCHWLITHFGMWCVSGLRWCRLSTSTVMTSEIVHMIIITEKYIPATQTATDINNRKVARDVMIWPRSGTARDVDGTDSATISMNTDSARSTVIPAHRTSSFTNKFVVKTRRWLIKFESSLFRTEADLLALVRRQDEGEQREAGDEEAGDDEVEAEVECAATQMHHERHVLENLARTTVVLVLVVLSRYSWKINYRLHFIDQMLLILVWLSVRPMSFHSPDTE